VCVCVVFWGGRGRLIWRWDDSKCICLFL